MKYFTYELAEKLGSLKTANYEEYERQWKKNTDSYWSLFESYNNILSKKIFTFFKKGQLHDSLLTSIDLKQKIGSKKIKHEVVIKFISYYDDRPKELIHKNVSNYSYFQRSLQMNETLYILYSELTKEGDEWTHNILFSNGDEVYIRFQSITLLSSGNTE